MRIALISPAVGFRTEISDLEKVVLDSERSGLYINYWSSVGVGLLILAALTPPEHQVDFIDENCETLDLGKRYDLVGISAMTQQVTRAYEIADAFRRDSVPVVLGGIHPTVMSDEAKAHADSVVIGEAEAVWPQLFRDFARGELKPFYRSRRPIDLASSPIPRYELLRSDAYHYIAVQTTRGCPHDCEYCAASKTFGKEYRTKQIDQVIEELLYVKKVTGKKTIFFADDNFFANRRFSLELLQRMTDLDFRWHAQTDISVGSDPRLLDLLSPSGCASLFIGFESLSADNLKDIDHCNWKYRQLKSYRKNIEAIQSKGVGVMGAFIVGLDSDDTSTFGRIADFVDENHLGSASVAILTPFPKTRLRERLLQEDRVTRSNWEDYTGYNVVIRPKRMTVAELESGIVELYRRIHNPERYKDVLDYFMRLELQRRQEMRTVPVPALESRGKVTSRQGGQGYAYKDR
jgi:radical SAM superfamily enzyme YgiQ (UPF0313 family)